MNIWTMTMASEFTEGEIHRKYQITVKRVCACGLSKVWYHNEQWWIGETDKRTFIAASPTNTEQNMCSPEFETQEELLIWLQMLGAKTPTPA